MIKKLPYKSFLTSFKLAPRIAINLLVNNRQGQILLAKRSIPPYVDYWHFPGCFLLKGESIEDCAKRVGKDELCLEIDVRKLKFKGIFEDLNSDPRGHVIDIIFNYTLSESNKSKFKPSKTVKELKFFIKIPINIGFNHKETLKKLGYT